MKSITKIEITFSECPGHKNPISFFSIHSANTYLRQLSRSHCKAEMEGYYKTDFKITFEDGMEYAGRIDLTSTHCEIYNVIGKHISDYVLFHTGKGKPIHLSEDQYQNILNLPEYKYFRKSFFNTFLETYNLELT